MYAPSGRLVEGASLVVKDSKLDLLSSNGMGGKGDQVVIVRNVLRHTFARKRARGECGDV
jgi:hypothetical protein